MATRKTPTRHEMEHWRSATQDLLWLSKRRDGDLIQAAELLVVNRLAELHRLHQRKGPKFIITRQTALVAQAIGMLVGVQDPDAFALPSLDSTKATVSG